MGISHRPERKHDTGAARDEWLERAAKMTAAERVDNARKNWLADDIREQQYRQKDRYGRKGCTGLHGFQIAPCGYSRCSECSSNGRIR